MNKDPFLYLDHILESIEALEKYTGNISKDDFGDSLLIQDAICRRLEIIGEAANKIEDEFKEKYPGVPWYKIVGMRNLLIHEYFHVDLDQVWNTVQKSIPELKKQIQEMYNK